MPPHGDATLKSDACHPQAEGGGPLAPRQSEAHTQREAQLQGGEGTERSNITETLDPADPDARWSLSSPSCEQTLLLLSSPPDLPCSAFSAWVHHSTTPLDVLHLYPSRDACSQITAFKVIFNYSCLLR
ncbi:hypothetical protein MG293_002206 [Ovis ammon polii]|uniref:Uncharacterized protein n=1 Tax=Ovis ammon polii TaxID=230172 RepID=A0AAD4UPB3_OVIAM|nr:hypothetical protein MG293_002206 [Ovis ammon polii]